jgi:uncharacterized membrane protein
MIDNVVVEKKLIELPPKQILWIMAIALFILFLISSVRHTIFHSTGFDLGIYDQVVYLISQGQVPISSFLGYHHLGNHGAWSVYPLALFYKIWPSVYWLLFIQSFSLAIALIPLWNLAKLTGLDDKVSFGVIISYLLYPIVFNVNLFDFHPEVMALPVIFFVLLCAEKKAIGWFTLGVMWILGCKAVLSLLIIGLGGWLLIFEKRVKYGLIALILGSSWFIIVTQGIIPAFSGEEVAAVGRYSYLGDSVFSIASNMLLLPHLVLGKIFSFDTLRYLFLLILPIIWGLIPLNQQTAKAQIGQTLTTFTPISIILFLNILSDVSFQRSLNYQYSLPFVPFFLLAMIRNLQVNQTYWQNFKSTAPSWFVTLPVKLSNITLKIPNFLFPKTILIWSLFTLILIGNFNEYFGYFQQIDNGRSLQQAVGKIQTKGGVLTDNKIAPHVTHRPMVKLLDQTTPTNLVEFDYVLLNLRYPWSDTKSQGIALSKRLTNHPQWQTSFQANDIILFSRIK